MTSRRAFLESTAAGVAAAAMPFGAARSRVRSYVDVLRPPDRVRVESADGWRTLAQHDTRWSAEGGIVVDVAASRAASTVTLTSPSTPIRRVQLLWHGDLSAVRQVLGDAWERAYGDLEWRGIAADRVMPWYCATYTSGGTHGYGVRTGAAAFCSWYVDPDGITLIADVRSGALPLQLGERRLRIADIVTHMGHVAERPFAALHALCRAMCAAPLLPAQPVYGCNDWYWAYGNNSADSVRRDATTLVELAPVAANRPFAVIDDGWQPERGTAKSGTGEWDRGNEKFPDMAALAADVRRIGARPGIWVRPLQAHAAAPPSWRLGRDRSTLDPTVVEVTAKVAADIARIHEWGYDLIKHDYSTFDILGRWGSTMAAAMTRDNWGFSEGAHRTTPEVIDDFYHTIQQAAGTSLVIGCNTVSHLSAGRFAINRIGDDTSGNEWGRTRKMGVNSLAFRGVQHGAFYAADPDCVGVTKDIPWSLNRQWLDLVSRSGTPLFVSLAPEALSASVRSDVRAALARAAAPQLLGEPLDWQTTVYPQRWQQGGRIAKYDWTGADAEH